MINAGKNIQGIYDDVCPANHAGQICGHDAGGKQIMCGPSCPPGATCYDPTLTSVVAGVYGTMILSTSSTAAVSPSLNMWNISMIFSKDTNIFEGA
jgi:hypothetical protein